MSVLADEPETAAVNRLYNTILCKHGWRRDTWWMYHLVFRAPFRNVVIALDTKALLKSQYWPVDTLEELQRKRTADLLVKAQEVPFWRKRLPIGFDLSRIPIKEKGDFRGKLYTEINPGGKQVCTVDYTSGSTGQPFKFFLDRHYELRSFAVCERMFRTVGGGKRLPVIVVRAHPRIGFAAHGAFWFYVRNYNSMRYRLGDIVAFAQKLGKEFIIYGFSSYLLEMARLCDELGIQLKPRAVIAAGEGLSPQQRSFIQDKLSTEVFTCYSTRELGWLGHECEYHSLHLNSEWAYVEIVDDEGKRVPDGTRGRIIVTTFDNEIMPFIRYDTGDYGVLTRFPPCRCDRTSPRLTVLGRQVEMIRMKNGRTVPFLDIFRIFDIRYRAIRKFQVIQRDLDDFLIKVVPIWPQFASAQHRIRTALQRSLHPDAKITFELVKEIGSGPGGKIVYFKPLSDGH